MISRKNGWLDELEGLKKLVGQDNVTTDGRRVNVYCNIGNEEDAERVLAADGGGIGLFRVFISGQRYGAYGGRAVQKLQDGS